MLQCKALINNLNWNCSDIVQKKAIEDLSKLSIEDIKYLIQPNGKECWSNAAIVIGNILKKNKISNQYQEKVVCSLMEWTQDLNWPGALTIVDILKGLDIDLVKKMIQRALESAASDEDEGWVYSLRYIIEKLDCIEEKDFKDLLKIEGL